MIDYESMSNEALDIFVTEKIGGFTKEDYSSISGNYHKGKPSDPDYRIGVIENYTGDWAVMGPIIQDKGITVDGNGVDGGKYAIFDTILRPVDKYLFIDKDYEQLLGDENDLRTLNLDPIQPSDVLGQYAIDAAMNGATVVFEGELIPVPNPLLYWDDGSCTAHDIHPNGRIIAWKSQEEQPSIETKINSACVDHGYDPVHNTDDLSIGQLVEALQKKVEEFGPTIGVRSTGEVFLKGCGIEVDVGGLEAEEVDKAYQAISVIGKLS